MTGESYAERAARTVADPLGQLRDTEIPVLQEFSRRRHAPSDEVLHRRDTYDATEALEERRGGVIDSLGKRSRAVFSCAHISFSSGVCASHPLAEKAYRPVELRPASKAQIRFAIPQCSFNN